SRSLTGKYLSGRQAIPVPINRRLKIEDRGSRIEDGNSGGASIFDSRSSILSLTIKGARQNNLKDIDVSFPLGTLIAVTGVSGSGKSSLVHEILYNTLARKLHRARTPAAAHDDILGVNQIDKVI